MRRADPAIALDRHVDVEPSKAVGQRRQRRERVVLVGERREKWRKSRAELAGESGMGAELRTRR